MRCIIECHNKCKKKFQKKKGIEEEIFINMKEELSKSLDNVSKTLNGIKKWDALFNPEEENEENESNEEEFKLNKININDKEYNNNTYLWLLNYYNCERYIESRGCLIFFFICGIFFCLNQLIGVQAGIIVLNAIFKEIVDEIKLALKHTPRKYNFYENLEIVSYKSVPEIDVGMTFCFLGTIFLKNYKYYLSNIFQLLVLICFILLFSLFDFHIGNELSNNYIPIEMTVLVFAYIILTILIGASSMIGLREFFNLYKNFYKKNCCNFSKYLCTPYLIFSFYGKCQKKEKKKK